jgi:septal ring factor EnvC (AmiA/AmiB activator)
MLAATPTWTPFVTGLVGALVTAGFSAWLVRRKRDADTADIITQASARVVEMMRDQIVRLERDVDMLRQRQVADQAERAALTMRLAQSEERERSALVRIGELQGELDALRLRVARYETPVTPPPAATTTTTTTVYQPEET